MTKQQVQAYLSIVDARIEAAAQRRVPSAQLIGYRKDRTGADVPQFRVANADDVVLMRALGLETTA